MNKIMVFSVAVLVAFGVLGDDVADLTQAAADSAVEAEFDQPDGAAIKMKDDGSFQIFARGTGTYDFNDPDDINDAKKEATLKAKAALAKFMNEKLSTEEGFAEASEKTKSMTGDGQTQSLKVSKTSVKTSSTMIKNQAEALLKGVITLKTQKIARGEGGEVQVTVGVSSKTIQAVDAAAKAMSTPATVPHEEGATTGVAAAPTVAPTEGVTTENGGADVALPEGWTLCVGSGSDRKAAIQAALVEGISQVYGQMLQNDERMSERMTKIKTQGVGAEPQINKKTEKMSQSQTVTHTAGFVREYRVIAVAPKDGYQEATVHALIVNPRAGGTKALMVKKPKMTITDRTKVYQLGPKKSMSGAEVANAILFALPNGLANANKFLILNDSSVKAVIENQVLTEAMVATGLSNASELMQAGQGLTPDVILETEITDIKYSKKLGQDKQTKKFGPMYKMSIKLNVSLTDARSGQAIKSDAITLSLDNEEITGLLEEDEDADLLSAILSKLSEPLEQWLKK